MDQALQERLDRIEQRMDTFEETLEQGKAELIQASAHNMHSISENSVEKKLNLALESLQQQQEQMKEFATRSSVDELARRVQEECRNAHIGAVHDMQVILENTVMKQLKLLAEGQQTLLETLAPRSKVEDLEEDVAMLKQVVRMMSQDIAELKKAHNSPAPAAVLLCGDFCVPIHAMRSGNTFVPKTYPLPLPIQFVIMCRE